MKCDLELVGDYQKRAGFFEYRCQRSGCPIVAYSPYGTDRIKTDCLGTPQWWEIGCWLEIFLGVFRIHKRGYLWLKHRLGFKPQCGCEQRAEAVNTLGKRFASWLRNSLSKPPSP